ncbi:hypothetical protein GCM10027294_14390 [Marinactinospora endophytica]
MPKVPEQPKGSRREGKAGPPASGASGGVPRQRGNAKKKGGAAGEPERPSTGRTPAAKAGASGTSPKGASRAGAAKKADAGTPAPRGRKARAATDGARRATVDPAPRTAGDPERGGDGAERGRPALTSRAAILALVMCVIALSLAYPLREYVAQRYRIAELQAEQEQIRREVEELQQRQDELEDPAYVEREARTRLHYQYPGETAYVVLDSEGAQEGARESEVPDKPWFTRLWESIEEADRARTEPEEIPEAQPPRH